MNKLFGTVLTSIIFITLIMISTAYAEYKNICLDEVCLGQDYIQVRLDYSRKHPNDKSLIDGINKKEQDFFTYSKKYNDITVYKTVTAAGESDIVKAITIDFINDKSVTNAQIAKSVTNNIVWLPEMRKIDDSESACYIYTDTLFGYGAIVLDKKFTVVALPRKIGYYDVFLHDKYDKVHKTLATRYQGLPIMEVNIKRYDKCLMVAADSENVLSMVCFSDDKVKYMAFNLPQIIPNWNTALEKKFVTTNSKLPWSDNFIIKQNNKYSWKNSEEKVFTTLDQGYLQLSIYQ